MEEIDLKSQIRQKLANYPKLWELFKDKIPESPSLTVKVYRDSNVEEKWGGHFNLWGILLNESDSQFKAYLHELNILLEKYGERYRSAYEEKHFFSKVICEVYSFLSEIQVYEIFLSNSVEPIIEPKAAKDSERRMDLSINLCGREILIEIITPNPKERLLKQEVSFAGDFDLSRKLAYEVTEHFSGLSQPISPTVIVIDGSYSGIDPIVLRYTIEKLQQLDEKIFISAILLYKSNWRPSMEINPTGPALTKTEISRLREIFAIDYQSSHSRLP